MKHFLNSLKLKHIDKSKLVSQRSRRFFGESRDICPLTRRGKHLYDALLLQH